MNHYLKWGLIASLFLSFIIFNSCNKTLINSDNSIIELADVYYKQTLKTYPEWAYFADIPTEDHSSITSNNLNDIKSWESFEDSIYKELVKINESSLTEKSEKITYWILKEALENNIEMRVCEKYLWDVTHLYGWHIIWTYIAVLQPVETVELRKQALERWNQYPSFVDMEIQNLRKGISEGYTVPKEIVNLVIEQLQVLLDYKIEESPFMSPAKRAEDQDFYSQWEKLIADKILPTIYQYQNFLEDEYLEAARSENSILAIPNGLECYQAYIRKYTTTEKTGKEIFESGQKIVQDNKNMVIKLGKDLYNSNEFTNIIGMINKDSSNYFKSSEEILDYSNLLLSNAKNESYNWFAFLPSTDVTIKPYEPHEAGIGSYESASVDKPPYFRINLNNANKSKKSEIEKLTFHETYPGHHLQIGIAKDIEGIHPISKLIKFTSYNEGWARYCEQLAEEMGLYISKSALIERRAWPARGMVVDTGIHLHEWTKEQAINYMMEAGMNQHVATSLYYRSIVWPAQLTAYDVGGEVIKKLRKLAEEKLNDEFDIKEFHTKILENGSIPLIPLQNIVEDWIKRKIDKFN